MSQEAAEALCGRKPPGVAAYGGGGARPAGGEAVFKREDDGRPSELAEEEVMDWEAC